MSNTRVPSVLWNVDQTSLLLDNDKQRARKNIGLVNLGSANLPVYCDSNGDVKPMNSVDGLPLVKTTSGSTWAGWSAVSSTSYYGIDMEVGGGQTNRGLWSKIPNQATGATSAVDDTWIIVKGTDRNSIFLNHTPGVLKDWGTNGGGYAFAHLSNPSFDTIRTTGMYSISDAVKGTNGAPVSGKLGLLTLNSYSTQSNGTPSASESDHYTTQLAMEDELLYRTKVGSGNWESWRPVLTQYKDTVGDTGVNGFRIAQTTVGNAKGDRTHYTAIINITPLIHSDEINEPFVGYLEIYQVKEDDKDRCVRYFKMLSTPKSSDYNSYGPFAVTGTNEGSSGNNYTHDWYICRPNTSETLKNFSITVTPILYEGNVLFRGLERTSSPATSYIQTCESTPAINSHIFANSSVDWGKPLYLNGNGRLKRCPQDALCKYVNGTSAGSRATPVYISNGSPTECSIEVGPINTQTLINNHMYTAIDVCADSSGNMGGASTGTADVVVFNVTFPGAYIPTYGSKAWPAGIMLMVNTSIYVANVTADYVDVQLYQDSTSIGVQRFNMASHSKACYLSPTFFAISADQINYQTHFYLKVGTPSGEAKVHDYTFTFKALI